MTTILDRLYLALEQGDPSQELLSDTAEEIRRLRFELNRVERERELAVAHDQQPYPSAESYERACADLETQRRRADKAESRLTESESLGEFMAESLSTIKSMNQMLTWRIQKVRELVTGSGSDGPTIDPVFKASLLEILGPEES
jgi:hypothetical protein